METPALYDLLLKIQSIARIGLLFSKDPYAIDNYRSLNNLSLKALEDLQGVSLDRNNYFARDIYPTPSISCRTFILNEAGEILLVKEAKTDDWSVPGGWCDLYDSPGEAARREVFEEAGVDITIIRLLGLLHRTPFKAKGSVPEYVVAFIGRLIGHPHLHCHETKAMQFFPLTDLPPLSRKLSRAEIDRFITAIKTGETVFD